MLTPAERTNMNMLPGRVCVSSSLKVWQCFDLRFAFFGAVHANIRTKSTVAFVVTVMTMRVDD